MNRAIVFYGVLCVTLLIAVAQAPAQQLLSQQMLSTAEWAELSNKDLKAATFYLKGVMETLGNTGNFTCRTPIVFAQTAIRIQLDVHDNPDTVHTWFIPALMADLTRHHHCRFVDPDRLNFLNQKFEQWEKEALGTR